MAFLSELDVLKEEYLTETLLDPGVVPYPLEGKLATDQRLPSPELVAPPPILLFIDNNYFSLSMLQF